MKSTPPIDPQQEGLVGNLYGIGVNHQNYVGETREHTEEDCWCWKEFDFGEEL